MSTKSTPKIPLYEEQYICVKCGNKQLMKSTQPILCSHCHSRVFRKLRTSNIIQFSAR